MCDGERERDLHRRPTRARGTRWRTGLAAVLACVLSTDLAAAGPSPGAAMTTGSGSAVGNVDFETVSGAVDFHIPAADKTTKIEVGLRVTNRSETLLRFTNFDTLLPALRDANGKAFARDGGRNRTLLPDVKNCPLLAPGNSVSFNLDAALYWQDGILRLGGSDGFGGVWYFSGIKPGSYEFRVGYSQKGDQLVLGTSAARALRQFWIGEAAGSPITVTISNP